MTNEPHELELRVEPHPLLCLGAFVTDFPGELGALATPEEVLRLFRADAQAPLQPDDSVRAAVRALLRHGGYKPTGRGKPASEYLLRAASEGQLGPINLAVDACNAVSLHSGLPISVVDLDRAVLPFRVAIAREGDSYVFNNAGQSIDLAGLVCLFDAQGPCANSVKDSQRTKTHPGSRRTLSIVWGTTALGDLTLRVVEWYRKLLASGGTTTRAVG